MLRTNECPKCGYTADTAFEVCVRCGIVVRKFRQRRQRTYREGKRFPEADKDGSRVACKTSAHIIRRGWLFPVPLVLVQMWVLFTSETIWTTKVYYASRYTVGEGVAGNHAIFSMVFFPLLYWMTYTPLIPALADRFGSVSGTSEMGAGCTVISVRVVSFLFLCLTTYLMVARYGQF